MGRYFSSSQPISTDAFSPYLERLSEPDIFLQVEPLPPHTPHLSSFLEDPTTWSQPALMHCPWTQMERVSGPHSVPSIT